jgi:antirestriction protein ArdC
VKGAKGIKIIAPAPFKVKQDMEKIDPKTQRPVIGKDGKPVTEETEVTIPYFKVVSVFDVSQTAGKELPTIGVDELAGNIEGYKDFFEALEKTSPAPISFEDIDSGAHGYYSLTDKNIVIQEGMSELQTLKTAIHEVAHAKLHDIDPNTANAEQRKADSNSREVEAESVAYTVCQHFGLDTSE